jgi:hypothetical protein
MTRDGTSWETLVGIAGSVLASFVEHENNSAVCMTSKLVESIGVED